VKLRGQRIELGEIEQCLLDTSVSACVVVKWSDDHLVAYVQSCDINEKQLRDHCHARLPLFMVPSIFIVLDQLPLNANGKVDRKRLPKPDFSTLSSSSRNDHEHTEPNGKFETLIHSLWCETLRCHQVSTNASIFTIGGHSLILMQLYHHYKIMFHFDTRSIGIVQFFQNPSIVDHARLLDQSANKERSHQATWLPLHITQGQKLF
jgi:hypothetical protein